jgi:hypothetical protein
VFIRLKISTGRKKKKERKRCDQFISIALGSGLELDPPHPPCVSLEATNWGGPSDEAGKTEVPGGVCTIKIPPCSKALSAEYRSKFAALHRQW